MAEIKETEEKEAAKAERIRKRTHQQGEFTAEQAQTMKLYQKLLETNGIEKRIAVLHCIKNITQNKVDQLNDEICNETRMAQQVADTSTLEKSKD